MDSVLACEVKVATSVAVLLPTPAANAEWIGGTDGDDHIVGTPQGDRIAAKAGDDDVSARGGADTVSGESRQRHHPAGSQSQQAH